MQITETLSDGLKREFTVVVGSDEIEKEMQSRLAELGRQVKLPGFRPGKVPMPVLKKRYGASVMGEVLERAVGESSSQAMRERNLRPALQPKIEIVSFKEGENLEYKMALEVLPEIAAPDYGQISLERLRPEIPESDVEEALQRIAKQNRKGEKVERAAQSGDEVVIDFKGSIDGVEFPGGAGTDFPLELGSGRFIPGFEDQLVGAKAGDTPTVKVSFPEDYGAENLAGKAAEFAVTVKEVRELKDAAIDDALASDLGFESLDGMKKGVREQMEREYGQIARQRLKRSLLDKLAELYDFTVPSGMVDMEFEGIWKQFEEARQRNKDAVAEDAGKSDDELKAEYRKIAERRVRLGLVLSDVGAKHDIQVTGEEMNRALADEARKHPGYEKQVIDFYRGNQQAIASLRAPIFEDKIVDFILEMAKVTDKTVPVADLLKVDEDEDGEKAAG